MRDFDNDGYKDLLIVKKLNVSPYTQETGLFRNNNFVFTKVSTTLDLQPNINVIDINNNNLVDIIESSSSGSTVYLANKALTN